MVDHYGPSHANAGVGYANVHDVVSSAAKVTISARLAALKALIPNPDGSGTGADRTGVVSASPDFDQIPPHTAEKLRSEIDSLETAILAAPHS